MKGNNGTGNNINRDDWETPNELIQSLKMQYGFDIDVCASEENKIVDKWSSDFELLDAKYLSGHFCWMNPPFSKAKEMFNHWIKNSVNGICIYRCDNLETETWQLILTACTWIHFIKGRINYEGHKGKGARFPSALIGFGVPPPKNIKGKTLKNI